MRILKHTKFISLLNCKAKFEPRAYNSRIHVLTVKLFLLFYLKSTRIGLNNKSVIS